MMNLSKYILFVLVLSLFLSGCKSIKDGITGKKQDTGDEFLVKKKNPLVLPPEYNKLPKPISDSRVESSEDNNRIKELLEKEKFKKDDNSKTVKSSLEDSILKKINKD